MADTEGARFPVVNDTDLNELIDSADSKNTKRQIKYAVNILSDYSLAVGSSLATVEGLTESELDSFFSRFFAALRKTDGSYYTKKSMQGIRYGIQRHFLALRNWDVVNKITFPESNKVFKALLVKLKKEGLGFVKHKSAIPQADFAKIIACDDLDISTPKGLQNKVFIDIMLFFCNRGQENLRDMKPSDFELETDDEGHRAITRRDRLTKNNREDADEITGGMMYEVQGDDRCPVESFLKYTSKLHPACTAFWQKPRDNTPEYDDEPWYCNAPVGINTIGKKMKIISTNAGCSRVYTNHCLRATCVTVLDRSGFSNRDIMAVSGHHSEQSIKHYSTTSDTKKREMSNAIACKVMPTSSSAVVKKTVTENANHDVPGPSRDQSMDTLGLTDDLPILSDSQEINILQEIANTTNNALNINNEMSATSSHQTMNFHGCVVHIHNNSK